MNKKYVRWLYGELPELVGKGIVSPIVVDKIREYYGDVEGRSRRGIALTVCSILGATLIGAGIILLLAHNWQDLSRSVRTVLALAPLVVSQGIAIWGMRRGKGSTAWREGMATFITFAVGASIALVWQTYHIAGDPGSFLLTWMLLTIPLVYLLGASVPCVLYFVGITSWSGYEQAVGGHSLFFWPLFALAVPHLWQDVRKNPYSTRSIVLCWAACLCICVATGTTLGNVLPGLWIIVYSAMFAVFYLVGSYWFDEAPGTVQRPFQSVGAVGIAVLSLLFTFEFPWEQIGREYYRYGAFFHQSPTWTDYLVVVLFPVSAICLLVMLVRRREKWRVLFGIMPVIAIIGYSLSCWGQEFSAMMLFNVYMFVLGLGIVGVGITKSRIGIVNSGMLILAALIIARFFDSDLGFVARGIAFIIIGAAFFAVNLILVKRMKGGAK